MGLQTTEICNMATMTMIAVILNLYVAAAVVLIDVTLRLLPSKHETKVESSWYAFSWAAVIGLPNLYLIITRGSENTAKDMVIIMSTQLSKLTKTRIHFCNTLVCTLVSNDTMVSSAWTLISLIAGGIDPLDTSKFMPEQRGFKEDILIWFLACVVMIIICVVALAFLILTWDVLNDAYSEVMDASEESREVESINMMEGQEDEDENYA